MLRPLTIRLPPTPPPGRCRADLHPSHLLASSPHSNAVPSNSDQMVLSLSLSLLPRPDTRHSRPSRTASGLTPATRRARVAASGASTAAAEPDQPASPSDDAAASVTGQTSSRHYDGVLTPPERRCVNRPAGAAPPSWNDPDQGAAGLARDASLRSFLCITGPALTAPASIFARALERVRGRCGTWLDSARAVSGPPGVTWGLAELLLIWQR